MTTTTRTAIADPKAPESALARLRWTLADTWTLVLRGFNYWRREPISVIGGMAFMIMLVALYGLLFGGAIRVPGGGSYMEFLLPGMFVMTMAFGIGETMTAVSVDAERGVTDRFRSMPMATGAVVIGRSVSDMIYSVAALAIMVGAGLVLGWSWHGTGAETMGAFGLLLMLRFAMLWVGIFLGLIIPGPTAVNAVWTILFPLTMVTAAFAPPETMPAWLAVVAEWNPLTATIYATRDLFGNPGIGAGSFVSEHALVLSMAWPILIVAIFAPLAVWRYRNLSR